MSLRRNRQRVIVAMSGGVDSSVAALKLLQEGYDVIGVMFHLWVEDCSLDGNVFSTAEAIDQARAVALQLGIPFFVVDEKDKFKQDIIGYFINDYISGRTPNPCYICNKKMKWEILLQKAKEINADFIATGHYAKVNTDNNGAIHLLKAEDITKDQSYILSGLTKSQLSITKFPLGYISKIKVREIAKNNNLLVAEKPDSQDICFIQNGNYRQFIQKYHTSEKGIIRGIDGNIIGFHEGLFNYTIGQRKGLGSGLKVPYYVIRKDIVNNEIIIGTKENLGSKAIYVSQLNWISGIIPNQDFSCSVKVRYKSIEMSCIVKPINNDLMQVLFTSTIIDATPGQIAVFYNNNEVLGSGIIDTFEENKI